MDPRDSELTGFLEYCVAAIQTVFPQALETTTALLHAPTLPSSNVIATTLSNEIVDLSDDFVLVLDDYHAIQHQSVHDVLSELVAYSPPNLHLVVVTRRDPPFPLAQLRAQRKLLEIRSDALRFSSGKMQNYLEQMVGKTLTPETVSLLDARTEGWIAGLRLAALYLRGRKNQEVAVDLIGDHHSLTDYFIEEVLSVQSKPVREFMLSIAILQRFCAPLCAAVTGQADADCQKIILWLEEANIFTVSLDVERYWYRFHHLFQELLSRQLQSHLTVLEINDLHRRASVWLGDKGLVDEAIHHALAADDVDQAAGLIEQQRLVLVNQENWRQLERWMKLLPDEAVRQRPGLLLAKAWILGFHFQLNQVQSTLHELEQRLASGVEGYAGALDESMLGEIDALYSGIYGSLYNDVPQTIGYAERALTRLPLNHHTARRLALSYLSHAYQAVGRSEDAVNLLSDAISAPAVYGPSAMQLFLAFSYVHYFSGELRRLWSTTTKFLSMATEGQFVNGIAQAHSFAGLVKYEWNELDDAANHFQAITKLGYGTTLVNYYNGMLMLAKTYLAQGLPTRAQETATG